MMSKDPPFKIVEFMVQVQVKDSDAYGGFSGRCSENALHVFPLTFFLTPELKVIKLSA